MILLGVDEAGRGPLAGPVVAAAVTLTSRQKELLVALGLRDSKKMTALRREKVFETIKTSGISWTAQVISSRVIDRINILGATMKAMAQAVKAFKRPYDGVVVDGNQEIPGLSVYQQAVVGGDDLYAEISAASVVAKVLRDHLMVRYDKLWPGYGFARHKGYGTAEHREAIGRLGPCAIHRRSFSWGIGHVASK